ncbi:sugar transferase [Candidatus Saccharibacteria bacterium]|nr:sugar transferase [Candidatus Saccharibacteria bacterium]
MRKNSDLYYKLTLLLLDIFALIASFTIAYILRVTLDPRPFYIRIEAIEFITSVAALLPIWVILFYVIGLYSRDIYIHPIKESWRLLFASVFGVMLMITFGFFTDSTFFPTKLVALYAMIISFVLLLTLRVAANLVRIRLLKADIGVKRIAIIGNNHLTHSLANYITNNPSTGFRISAIVAKAKFIPKDLQNLRFSSLPAALKQSKIDGVIQTDPDNNSTSYHLAEEHYLEFYQAPSIDGSMTARHSIEIIDSTPLILIKPTPLSGYGRIAKRLMDIVGSVIGIIITSPIMLIVALLIKITDPKGPILMQGKMRRRLTRYNRVFEVYKFRSHYAKFDGKTDEEVFQMVGKPELIEEYRKNGDKLDHDFRVTPVGRFIRRFSLDELPQLFNVLKGDISLVGPRALVPHELNKYDKKNILLSVKSGLTGLAVISGRRDISFEERRRIDLYYVQNWSVWLDISILFKTILVVFKGS